MPVKRTTNDDLVHAIGELSQTVLDLSEIVETGFEAVRADLAETRELVAPGHMRAPHPIPHATIDDRCPAESWSNAHSTGASHSFSDGARDGNGSADVTAPPSPDHDAGPLGAEATTESEVSHAS